MTQCLRNADISERMLEYPFFGFRGKDYSLRYWNVTVI